MEFEIGPTDDQTRSHATSVGNLTFPDAEGVQWERRASTANARHSIGEEQPIDSVRVMNLCGGPIIRYRHARVYVQIPEAGDERFPTGVDNPCPCRHTNGTGRAERLNATASDDNPLCRPALPVLDIDHGHLI
jgi:hypothetical protein